MRSHKFLLVEPSLIYFVPALHITRGQREAKECNVVIESKRLRPLLYRPKLNGEEDRRQVVGESDSDSSRQSGAPRDFCSLDTVQSLPARVQPLTSTSYTEFDATLVIGWWTDRSPGDVGMDDWVVAERDRPVAVRSDLCVVGATIQTPGLYLGPISSDDDEDALLLASRRLAPPTSLDDTQNRYRWSARMVELTHSSKHMLRRSSDLLDTARSKYEGTLRDLVMRREIIELSATRFLDAKRHSQSSVALPGSKKVSGRVMVLELVLEDIGGMPLGEGLLG
ncbi:hypothetical protein BDN71DRAFT_1435416 [Pleurotus eryngii]|uniref:Uncharacterized protein n=1 Tax=Pleurotus eryngii TaxID=5323 RepID=A0A9P5ZJU9_PLEER|nr:hypothetical protein BDN71DRAFT_1435416 [Pleurotus eryngii]